MHIITWLLPILFMLHDFEEIIMIEAWKQRNRICSTHETNNFLSTKIPYSDMRSTASFSIAVAIEFFLLSITSLYSAITGTYYIWFSLMFAVTFHYIIHLKMCIDCKGYVPGITTAVVFFPVSIAILLYAAQTAGFTFFTLSISIAAGILFGVLLIKCLHGLMARFDGWLEQYKG